MTTSFTSILKSAVEHTPGALAAIFADSDGEAIDQVARKLPKDDLLVLGAHYGVLLHLVRQVLLKLSLGGMNELLIEHDRMNVLMRPVVGGYYVVMALERGGHLGTAFGRLEHCVASLRAQL